MKLLACVIAGSIIAVAAASAALAQIPPGLPDPALQNRIPAPLPPPPQPPIINGPVSQSPPAGTYLPPRLNTHSDRTTACVQEGSGYGLRGRKLDAYARACANQ
jgi:hypothetical protein